PELTDWPIERISEVVQPVQRQALDELRAASVKAIEILQSGCPKDLPSIPTGRLSAMENRLQVMLAAVQTVRPALERFYRSLSDEQKARRAASPSPRPDPWGSTFGRPGEVDDVAREDLALVELVAPNDDGLEGERAFAQPGDHRLAAGLERLAA